MSVKYSLQLLKEELSDLQSELTILQRVDKKESTRRITKLEHQVSDLKYAIEILEPYEMSMMIKRGG